MKTKNLKDLADERTKLRNQLVNKVIDVLRGQTTEDALDVIVYVQHKINTDKHLTLVK